MQKGIHIPSHCCFLDLKTTMTVTTAILRINSRSTTTTVPIIRAIIIIVRRYQRSVHATNTTKSVLTVNKYTLDTTDNKPE